MAAGELLIVSSKHLHICLDAEKHRGQKSRPFKLLSIEIIFRQNSPSWLQCNTISVIRDRYQVFESFAIGLSMGECAAKHL